MEGPSPPGAPASYAAQMRAEDEFGSAVQRAVMARLGELPSAFDEATGSLAQRRRAWRATIAAAPTDLSVGERDPLGDGDQSALEAHPRAAGFAKAQRLFDVWGQGADWQPPETLRETEPFAALCWLGMAEGVRREIARARRADAATAAATAGGGSAGGGSAAGAGAGAAPVQPQPRSSALTRLLETRNALHRFAPLHACVDGSRQYAVNKAFLDRAFPGGGAHCDVARALVEAGARVDAKDMAGYSSLHHCVTSSASRATLEIGAVLVAAGADVRSQNRRGVTLMQECVMARRADILAALLEWGADPLQADPSGLSALKMSHNPPWPEGARRMAEAVHRAAARARGEGGADALKGQRVRIHGLTKAAHLNGRFATLEDAAAEPEGGGGGGGGGGDVAAVRLRVRILPREGDAAAGEADPHAGTVVAVRRECLNFLEIVPETRERLGACGGCAKDAFFRCSGCFSVFYCSVECQKADWPGHKAACKQARASAQAVIFLEGPQKPPTSKLAEMIAGGKIDWVSRTTGKKDIAAADRLRPELGFIFAVKVQVPIGAFGASEPSGDAEIAVYCQDRTVQVFLPKTVDGPAYKLLDTAVRGSVAGNAGLKAYLNARLEVRGGHEALVIDVGRLLPAQPW